jgi:endonuclease III
MAALDEGAARVLVRWLGLTAGSERRRRRAARAALAAAVGRDIDALTRAVTLLVHHARHACLAQAPHCGVCPLRAGCAHAAGAGAAVS